MGWFVVWRDTETIVVQLHMKKVLKCGTLRSYVRNNYDVYVAMQCRSNFKKSWNLFPLHTVMKQRIIFGNKGVSPASSALCGAGSLIDFESIIYRFMANCKPAALGLLKILHFEWLNYIFLNIYLCV